jgi:hypothetical protein
MPAVTMRPPLPPPRARRSPPRPTRNRGAGGPAFLREILLDWPAVVSRSGLVARAAFLALLAVWTARFLRHGMDAEALMDSFLHLVNLPFHEAGHVLLTPFGRFLSVLGGSLLQVAIPLLCGAVFLLKSRDPFAASVTLWWAGQSLMDLAPYVADARALRLPLLGGRTGAEVEGHDWEYLLGALGLMEHDVTLGKLSFALGALAMLGALAWGGAFLWRLRARLRAS